MGNVAYDRYRNSADDLNELEQLGCDLNMKNFIEKYRGDVEIATIRLMTETTLTKSEWERIGELMTFKLQGNLWEKFLSSGLASLTEPERIELDLVGEEWMSPYWQIYA